MYMWECGLGQRSFVILALYPIHIHHLAVQLEYIFKNFHEYEYDALSDHIDLATGKQVCFYEINCMILFLVTQQIKACSLTILCIILFLEKSVLAHMFAILVAYHYFLAYCIMWKMTDCASEHRTRHQLGQLYQLWSSDLLGQDPHPQEYLLRNKWISHRKTSGAQKQAAHRENVTTC